MTLSIHMKVQMMKKLILGLIALTSLILTVNAEANPTTATTANASPAYSGSWYSASKNNIDKFTIPGLMAGQTVYVSAQSNNDPANPTQPAMVSCGNGSPVSFDVTPQRVVICHYDPMQTNAHYTLTIRSMTDKPAHGDYQIND